MAGAVSRRLPLLGLMALGLTLYLPGLGVEILRHPLEAKYALAAREMLRGGPRLVAHVFGELYPDKPPLYFWITATLGWIEGGRLTEVTARLPAAMAALGGLLVVYRLGADLFGARAGFVSAAILATSSLFFWYARQGHPDQMLTTCVALAGLGLWRSFGAEPGRPRTGWVVTAYVAMALGVLSKGLLGLVLPLLGASVYLVLTGPVRALPGRLRLGPGLAVFLAVVLGWYGPAVAQNGRAYLYETLVHQQVVRYAHSWVHTGPWYYYLAEFTTGFFPWSLFVPGALILGWRARREPAGGEAPPATPRTSPFLFPLAWFLTGFVFFSLSSSKRGAYLLPLYPAAALMVGWLWDRLLARHPVSRWVGVPLAILIGAAAVLAGTLVLLPRRMIPGRMIDTMVPADPWQQAGMVVLLSAGAVAVWWPWRARRPAIALGILVLVQAAALLGVTIVRAPQYEARFPARELAARIERAVPAGQPVLSLLDDYDFIVAFYLDRPLTPLPGPSELFATRGVQPRYALVDQNEQAVLREPGVQSLAGGQLGPRQVTLIRLDPARP